MFHRRLSFSLCFAKLIVVIGMIGASFAHAQLLTLDQKLSDFQQLNQTVESGYGPYQYKNEALGYNLLQLKAKYEERIRETRGNRDFYYLLKQYIAEFHDGHFRAELPTTHTKSLPITTEWVNGQILIDTVDRTVLPVEKFPFERGDEIVTVNGRPVMDEVNELKSYFGSGFHLSETRRGARLIFRRPGYALPVPTAATIVVEIRKGETVKTIELEWIEKGQPLDEILLPQLGQPMAARAMNLNLKLLSTISDWSRLLGSENLESSYQCSGTTRVAIPEGATMILQEPFVAYYHSTAKGNIGYLRIPHYYWQWADGDDPAYAEKVFDQYQYVISVLEQNTVGLIIDQDHNCGGSVDFLEAQLGLFLSTPYKPMQFRFRGTKANFLEFKKGQEDYTTPNTLAYNLMQKVVDAIGLAWTSGVYMTELIGIDGDDVLQPNFVNYTKPIVMTIDEMSGSGGDAFPAMMQGFGRAKLVGTRTSGLGGHVTEIPALNYTGLTVDMTKSLFYRPDGVPVENNGAVPDLNYVITRDDFMNEYRDYQKFYLDVLFGLLP